MSNFFYGVIFSFFFFLGWNYETIFKLFGWM